MKGILTMLALLALCEVSFSQPFVINYNQSTNTMSVVYTGCEICRMRNVNAIKNCECWNKCSDEVYAGLQDCLDDCDEYNEPGSLDHEYCVDYCVHYLHNPGVVCPAECGEYVEPIRTPVAYAYTLVAAWAPIPFDPRNFQQNWQTYVSPNPIISSNVLISNWNVPLPWPGIHTGHNTCYGIGISIRYNDGTVCSFTQWECNFIG
jgi:hypothetical protein